MKFSVNLMHLCISDNRLQEELLRTTQLIYSCESGRMVMFFFSQPSEHRWFIDVVRKVAYYLPKMTTPDKMGLKDDFYT